MPVNLVMHFLCNIVVLVFKVYLFKNINSKINKENINDNLDLVDCPVKLLIEIFIYCV